LRRPQGRAFEELLGQHVDALFRTALRLCGGHEADAEDLLQDATLRAFEGYHQLRDTAAGRSWLFTILLRTHLNQLRSRRRLAETASTDLAPEAFEAALAAWQPGLAPDEEADLRLLGDRLVAALDKLTSELRSTVWLVDVEGFTQREVAMMHEVPVGTIASRLFRARRLLRVVLQPSGSANQPWRGRRWSSTS
jgi:RNA polymerase sigma-70 factor (ECF subfamily)